MLNWGEESGAGEVRAKGGRRAATNQCPKPAELAAHLHFTSSPYLPTYLDFSQAVDGVDGGDTLHG